MWCFTGLVLLSVHRLGVFGASTGSSYLNSLTHKLIKYLQRPDASDTARYTPIYIVCKFEVARCDESYHATPCKPTLNTNTSADRGPKLSSSFNRFQLYGELLLYLRYTVLSRAACVAVR